MLLVAKPLGLAGEQLRAAPVVQVRPLKVLGKTAPGGAAHTEFRVSVPSRFLSKEPSASRIPIAMRWFIQ